MEKSRIGIFGGTFNPIHMGHINSMLSITEKAGLDKIYAIPANQNPLKADTVQGPTAEDRLEMVRQGLEDYELIAVDSREVERGGKSYTIDTLRAYTDEHSSDDISLIIGADEFAVFDQWKDFDEILKIVNLIVTTRPGQSLPRSVDQLPEGLQKMVAAFDTNYVELETGRNIQIISLNDVDISASEIRKRVRTGKNLDKYVPIKVENYIKEKGLYQPEGDRVGDYKKFAEFAANTLFSRKGIMVRAFDLQEIEAPCDYTVIASGTSTRHAQALSEHVVRAIKDEYGMSPISIEGQKEAEWILLDFGGLMVHVFYDYVRNKYKLEELWSEGTDLNLKDPFTGEESAQSED